MSYERAMGTESGNETISATLIAEEIEEPAISTEERSQLVTERGSQRQRELDEMWRTGRWREGSLFGRWLLERRRTSPVCKPSIMRWPCAGFTTWAASGHCALVVPTGDTCSGMVPYRRWIALGAFVWPLLTSYYAWRKTDGCWGWAALGALAGFATIPPLQFAAILASGGSLRY